MTETTMTFHPSLLPETADPMNSTRYQCCILHYKTPISKDEEAHTKCYDDIADKGIFLVDEYSSKFESQMLDVFQGTVLIEENGVYSWWRDLL